MHLIVLFYRQQSSPRLFLRHTGCGCRNPERRDSNAETATCADYFPAMTKSLDPRPGIRRAGWNPIEITGNCYDDDNLDDNFSITVGFTCDEEGSAKAGFGAGLKVRQAIEGIVTEKELAAAEAFQAIFDRAQLRERYAVSSSLINRVDGTRTTSDDSHASMYEARERIMEALSLLGGSMGPVVWDVIGSEVSLREHVARQAGVKRVTVHEARGRLIAGLDILARAWL